MKLIAKDQIHISGVSSDTLRPGQVFEVGDQTGEQLLKDHPATLATAETAKEPAAAPRRKGRGISKV